MNQGQPSESLAAPVFRGLPVFCNGPFSLLVAGAGIAPQTRLFVTFLADDADDATGSLEGEFDKKITTRDWNTITKILAATAQ